MPGVMELSPLVLFSDSLACFSSRKAEISVRIDKGTTFCFAEVVWKSSNVLRLAGDMRFFCVRTNDRGDFLYQRLQKENRGSSPGLRGDFLQQPLQ